VTAGGAPPAPAGPMAPQGGPQLLASLRLQKLHVQQSAAVRARRPTESGSPLAWGLGTWSTGSRLLQAVGPCLIDAVPVDEEVLRALVLELGLNRADELPELWLGHHEFDCPADLPAG
ncbi:CITE1 protein, partial [Xiphorhynchus elegans]|nr:CITE1 protein [Xiphorhynchus elegans]